MKWFYNTLYFMGGGSDSGISPRLDWLRERFLPDIDVEFVHCAGPYKPEPGVVTRDVYHERRAMQKIQAPIAWFFLETVPSFIDFRILSPTASSVWWLLYRFHPRHRYNIIKTSLKPGYYDVDCLMIEAIKELTRRYVEDEMGGVSEVQGRIDWLASEESYDTNAPEELNDHSREISKLQIIIQAYNWWFGEKPEFEKQEREHLLAHHFDESRKLELEIDEKDEHYAIEMIKTRQMMWS